MDDFAVCARVDQAAQKKGSITILLKCTNGSLKKTSKNEVIIADDVEQWGFDVGNGELKVLHYANIARMTVVLDARIARRKFVNHCFSFVTRGVVVNVDLKILIFLCQHAADRPRQKLRPPVCRNNSGYGHHLEVRSSFC